MSTTEAFMVDASASYDEDVNQDEEQCSGEADACGTGEAAGLAFVWTCDQIEDGEQTGKGCPSIEPLSETETLSFDCVELGCPEGDYAFKVTVSSKGREASTAVRIRAVAANPSKVVLSNFGVRCQRCFFQDVFASC